jgi:hypothetical protein
MSRIPLQSDGKRPRFFAESGTDETISMLLELMSELWTVKERLYALERAAEEAGLDLTSRIEAWQPSDSQSAELDDSRQQMIASVLRSLEARHVRGAHLRQALDEDSKLAMDAACLPEESPVRAA